MSSTIRTQRLGKVERHIASVLSERPMHMTILDPERHTPESFAAAGETAEDQGTDLIAVGGSMGIFQLDEGVELLKKRVHVPVLVFPSNVWSISTKADAFLFLRLMNSRSTYFMTDLPILLAPLVRRSGIETIPVAYHLVEPGRTAGWVSDAKLLPRDRPDIAAASALAGQLGGAHFNFFEAGSGASRPIPTKMIRAIRGATSIPLIVGSGIRTGGQARAAVSAGADVVDTGTLFEQSGNIRNVVKSIKSTRRPERQLKGHL